MWTHDQNKLINFVHYKLKYRRDMKKQIHVAMSWKHLLTYGDTRRAVEHNDGYLLALISRTRMTLQL